MQATANTTLASIGSGATAAIGGNVTMLSTGAGGGTFSPGDSGDSTGLTTVGKLTVGGNMTLGGAGQPAHLAMEIGGTTGGTLYDQIQIASGSTVSLANANLDLSFVNSSSFSPTSLTLAPFNSGTGQLDQTGTLIFLVTGSLQAVSGTFANAGAADPNLNGFGTYTVGGQEFAISYTADATANGGLGSFTGGHDIALMAIPEPNSLAMLAGSIGLALSLQRFRRKGRRS